MLLNSWPIWDRNVSKITKWGCEEQRSLQPASYHHHKAPFLCWGTSINDVRRFSVIFDLPTLPCYVRFWGYCGPPYQYPKIGRHLQMLGCGAHVRIIALPHVRCACGSACGKGFELCVRKCVRMGNFQRAICDRTFLPVLRTYFRSS